MKPNGGQASGVTELSRLLLRSMMIVLAVFAVIDAIVFLVCPRFGGDCLYGFLSLIAFPVILSGPLGAHTPRIAMRYGLGWRGRALTSIGGAALLAAFVTVSHVIAIWLLNSFDYGGVLVRDRLLVVGLALSLVYYSALSIIAYVKGSDRGD